MLRISLVFFLMVLISCSRSPTEYAKEWSDDIKSKILEDAFRTPDSSYFDSTRSLLTFYRKNNKLKSYFFKVSLERTDTATSTFHSDDQKFELRRELCPVVDRNFEGIVYNGSFVGLVELRYCNGKLKKRGFRYGEMVGIWKEYDQAGNETTTQDYGNENLLENLKGIKYYR